MTNGDGYVGRRVLPRQKKRLKESPQSSSSTFSNEIMDREPAERVKMQKKVGNTEG